MTLTRAGGAAALICGLTYVTGFALLVSVLAPLGYGSARIDPAAVVAFIDARPGLMIFWNSTIYIFNALALAVLVVALSARAAPLAPGWAGVARGLGLIWAALVLAAGMIANVAVEQAARIFPTDPAAAAESWMILHSVELGLGGGNEIAGGAWIACASVAARRARLAGRALAGLGIGIGLSGLATLVPALGDPAGAVFGLGAIGWFLALGVALLRDRAGKAVSVNGKVPPGMAPPPPV